MFNEDLNQCLAFLTEAKTRALHERKSIDWDQAHIDIATYLDNVSNDAWRSEFIPLLEGVMTDTASQLALSFGSRFNVQNIGALQWFDEYTLTFAQEITGTTKVGLGNLMQQAKMDGWSIKQMQDNMELMFKQWRDGSTDPDEWDWYDERMPNYRREMIARTESMRASNYGAFNIMRDTGSAKKEWLATADDRTRDTHMQAWSDYGEGKGIPIDQPFIVGGEHMMFPGDPDADPSESINCRCTFVPDADSSELNDIPLYED